VGDVVSGVCLGLFGRGHRALGPNRKSQFFDSSFSWKLRCSSSLLSLWWLSNVSGSNVMDKKPQIW